MGSPAPETLDILVVEDSIDDTRMTLRALRRMEPAPQTVVAVDGKDALELLYPTDGGPARLPRLVLLDLKLPKIGGLDVLKAIRSSPDTAEVPVVILTSSNEPRDQRRATEYGATEYIVKPGDYQEYLDAVIGAAHRYLFATGLYATLMSLV